MALAVDTLPFATKTTLATSAMASFTALQPPPLLLQLLLLEAQVGRQHHCMWQHNQLTLAHVADGASYVRHVFSVATVLCETSGCRHVTDTSLNGAHCGPAHTGTCCCCCSLRAKRARTHPHDDFPPPSGDATNAPGSSHTHHIDRCASKNHVHSATCGHEQVPHEDHMDYLVGTSLHHPHGEHCDRTCIDAGTVSATTQL